MVDTYAKTEAGRREIRAREISLTRPGRTLLLIIDDSKSGNDWLKLVQGSTGDDLAQLLNAGLIATDSTGQGSKPGTGRSGDSGANTTFTTDGPGLAEVLETLSYQQLYDLITSQARPRLGLIKGYKMVLEVERCNGPAEIRVLTQRFIAMVRDIQGEAGAMDLHRILGAQP